LEFIRKTIGWFSIRSCFIFNKQELLKIMAFFQYTTHILKVIGTHFLRTIFILLNTSIFVYLFLDYHGKDYEQCF